jgi:hypothetical protein
MSTLTVAPALDLAPNDLEIVNLCDEAAHIKVDTYGSPNDERRPLSTLRGIVIHGRLYEDKVASCSCDVMRLFAFGEDAYTVCQAHGLQAIGRLRPIIGRR